MKRPDFLFRCAFAVFFFSAAIAWADAPPVTGTQTSPLLDKMRKLDDRLEKIEKDQAEILENQKEILKQISSLKIIVRRS